MDLRKSKKYCISVDGSAYSEYGFDLVFDELYEKGDSIFLTHISNSEKLKEIPFEYQPQSIQSKYESKLIGKLPQTDFEILLKDKMRSDQHALEITHDLAKNRICSVLVTGYQGHKGGSGKDLSKGIVYLIKNVKIPTFIIRERSQRRYKESGGFTWLVCIEKSNTRSYTAFEFAVNYINKDVDKIIGVNIVDGYKDTVIELQFNSLCKKTGIKNCSFQYINRDKAMSVTDHINEIVNYGQESVDFLVVGHNPAKYLKMDEYPLVEVMRKAKTNILFYS